MEKPKNSQKTYVKRFVLDAIKILFGLLIFSTLFHSEISKIIDSFSDFAFHHYFFATFLALFFLVITIEYEFFNGDHWLTLRAFFSRIFSKTKKTI